MKSLLPIAGQGVFVFEYIDKENPTEFTIMNHSTTDGIKVSFTHDHVTVSRGNEIYEDVKNHSGLSPYTGAYYWFSLDSQNQRFFAGVGEARIETAIYSYQYSPKTKEEHRSIKDFLESLTTVHYSSTIYMLRIIRDPITQIIPLIVKDIDQLTMSDIASATYMPIVNLPTICQKLYNCIAGEKFVLDTPDFPDFTQAIEYSIRTPGMWCYQKLLDKSREFNPDKPNPIETYLRITLGQNNGESPGIPYVMEIWPIGHYSPIHSHANGNAIIRVLNGEIHVSLFPFLCAEKESVPPFGSAVFKKGDITWITPTLNQTHQLKNLETNTYTCITIQCYMYNDTSNTHYDYFDYLDDNGEKQQYEPDSDMDFIEFKKKIKEEWNHYNKKKNEEKNWMLTKCFF